MNGPERSELAARLAAQLIRVPGVVGVVLGGSLARGTADQDSDIDLGVFYRDPDGLDLEALGALARRLDRSGTATIHPPGAWGDWIVGGAWLTIEDRRVDWLFRPIERVGGVVDECCAGRFATHAQPGHPHGFHSFIWFGEVAVSRILQDPDGRLGELQSRTRPYPEALRAAIVERFAWDARFTLATCAKAADRGDVAYVCASLARVALDLAVVLFARNEVPYLNEKGATRQAGGLPVAPAAFEERIASALSVDAAPRSLAASVSAMGALVADVEALCS